MEMRNENAGDGLEHYLSQEKIAEERSAKEALNQEVGT